MTTLKQIMQSEWKFDGIKKLDFYVETKDKITELICARRIGPQKKQQCRRATSHCEIEYKEPIKFRIACGFNQGLKPGLIIDEAEAASYYLLFDLWRSIVLQHNLFINRDNPNRQLEIFTEALTAISSDFRGKLKNLLDTIRVYPDNFTTQIKIQHQ